jgi:outer membrane protein
MAGVLLAPPILWADPDPDPGTGDGSGPRSDADCDKASPDCVQVGHWNVSVALGAGVRTNPLVHGADLPLVVVPQFSYYGKRFFLDDLDLGFTVAETPHNQFNLVASPGYDRVFFYRSDVQNILVGGFPTSSGDLTVIKPGAPTNVGQVVTPVTTATVTASRPRRITYLAGGEWTFNAGGITGQFDVLHEITGQNGGDEVRAAVSVPLYQGNGSLRANVGVTWKSAAIVDYYYGVPGTYDPGSALDPFVKLGYRHPVNRHWTFTAFAEYELLGAAIEKSPLINEPGVTSVFVGMTYGF